MPRRLPPIFRGRSSIRCRGGSLGAAFRVSSTLGQGFLEKVYENSLVHELRKAGLHVEQQCPVQVRYDGQIVGDYITDILVERVVILEIKAAGGLDRVHYSQCANYLRATGLRICLLLNFGLPSPRIETYRPQFLISIGGNRRGIGRSSAFPEISHP